MLWHGYVWAIAQLGTTRAEGAWQRRRKPYTRPKTAPLAGGGTSATGKEAGEDDYHRDHLASHTADEELATADLLDEEPGEGGEDGVVDHVDTADERGHELGLAEGLLKKDGEVVYHGVTAGQLLRDLRRRTDEHAVQVLGSTASEQVGVTRTFGDTGTKVK